MLSEPQSWHGVYEKEPTVSSCSDQGRRISRGQTYRRANLYMKFPNRVLVIHRIERSHLIYPHRRHVQYLRNFIHHTYATETKLALSQIEEWHHGRLLVLWGIAFEDLLDEPLVEGGEFEGDGGIVLRCGTML